MHIGQPLVACFSFSLNPTATSMAKTGQILEGQVIKMRNVREVFLYNEYLNQVVFWKLLLLMEG